MNKGRIILDIEGLSLREDEEEMLKLPAVAGVLLFTRNYQNKKQLKKLISEIRKVKNDLIISVDHEGGQIQRFKEDFTKIPKARYFGEVYENDQEMAIKEAQTYGEIMAKELLDLDIDLSFAPILDLHNDKSSIIGQLGRAFHSKPETVVYLAQAFISGMHKAGMAACGKHFPGHGSVDLDSHLSQVVDSRPWQELEKDLLPFKELQKKLNAIMPAHIIYSCKDRDNVVCRSKKWSNFIRETLKYEGCLISDCLSMKSVHKELELTRDQTWEERIYFMVSNALRETLITCDLIIMSNIETLNVNLKKPSNHKEIKVKIIRELLDLVPKANKRQQERILKLRKSNRYH